MTLRFCLRQLLFAGWAALLLNAQTAAQIGGQIRDPRLRPVSGARVHAYIAPAAGSGGAPFHALTLSARDGGFQFAVPAGTFRICVEMPNSQFLETCRWEKPLQVTVAANQTLRLPPITLRRGYPLTVRIEDPQGFLPTQANAKTSSTQVMIGVKTAGGVFIPVPVRGRLPGAKEHVINVPRDTALAVSLHARGLVLTDAKGKNVDAIKGHELPVKLGGESNPKTIVFQVTGKGDK